MAARLTLIGPLSAGLILVLLGMAWFAHISPWFMWGIVADADALTLFFDIPASLRPALAELDARYNVTSTLPLRLNTVRRLAWHRSGDSQTLAVVPTVGQGDTVKDQLTQAGWRHQRLGGLIVASPVSHPAPPARTLLGRGSRELIRHLAFDNLPFQPLALLDMGIRGYIVYDRHQLVGSLRTDSAWPQKVIAPAESGFGTERGLVLALPSQALSAIPPDLLTRWQLELVKRFALDRSRPSLVKELGKFAAITASFDADDAALGARSHSISFLTTAESWLVAEQGYQTPRTVAFRLPDGTLGYEKRPSHAPIAWQIVGDGSCRTTSIADVSYWLCQHAEAAALGTSEDSARRALAALTSDSPWHVQIGPTLAEKLTTLPIAGAQLSESSPGHIILRIYVDHSRRD